MSRNRFIRRTSANRWNSATSRRANKARWDADRARRDAEMPERIAEIQAIEMENLPRKSGDILGTFQWADARSGKVRRWVVRIGDRVDQITVEFAGDKPSESHGWAWLFTKIRKHILNQ
jgi:hypothetical protein